MTEIASMPWTVERANKALPLVRRIAADLVRAYSQWRELVERFEVVSTSNTTASSEEAERLQREVQRVAAEIEDFVEELHDLGVECKSFETGFSISPPNATGVQCICAGSTASRGWPTGTRSTQVSLEGNLCRSDRCRTGRGFDCPSSLQG